MHSTLFRLISFSYLYDDKKRKTMGHEDAQDTSADIPVTSFPPQLTLWLHLSLLDLKIRHS